MTRRERLERKIEKRREWAEGREQKADSLRGATPDSLRHDWAFITQPGHIPERARMNRRDDKAMEHDQMARHHVAKADGLEHQLDRTIFSDDGDAIEELEKRIADNEAKRDRMKEINRLYRKNDAEALLARFGLDLEKLQAQVAAIGYSWVKTPYEGYQLTNIGARIRGDKQRIEEVKRRSADAQKAEDAGGVLITEHGEYAQVTFSEKPDRSILNELKDAGFHWGSGAWYGSKYKVPASVLELAG